jgi:outer membrane biosynthesis protein TonB
MEAIIQHQEENSRRKSSILSLLLFLLLIVTLVIPIFSYQIPPPEQAGIVVSFGEPEKGSRQDAPDVQSEDPTQQTTEANAAESESDVEEEQEVKEIPTPAAPAPVEQKLKSKIEKEVIVPKSTEKVKNVSAVKPKIDLEAQKLLDQQKAAAAAAKAAAEKQEAFEKSKKQFGDLLSGSGKGNTNTSGNQGDPEGDPNADVLKGITKGSGRIAGGLANRGLLYEPEVKDNSQKRGKVVMKVCVNSAGKVIESSFTQSGSTTVDGELRAKAERAAQSYKFTASEIEEQCGTITFDFKVE